MHILGNEPSSVILPQTMWIRLGYCFTPYPRPWLYNGAPLVAFYDTLGIRRTYSRLKPPVSPRGSNNVDSKVENDCPKVPKQAEAKRDGVINPQNYNFNQF